jgi:3-methyladenine DNA glycosylase AlkD
MVSRTGDVASIRTRLRALADPDIAAHSQRFFKTGAGQYGAGDRFLGIRVPVLRKLAREHREAPVAVAWALLGSRMHEERLLALLMLVDRFARGGEQERAQIYARYLELVPSSVNNWDLVDTSARIVGEYLETRSRKPLYKLARSKNLWERRVAIIATQSYVRRGVFTDTLALAEILLDDREDLIHKAVGWMVREVGNRDRAAAEAFLAEHHRRMPRTMLRYAIEKLPESCRRAYLTGAV